MQLQLIERILMGMQSFQIAIKFNFNEPCLWPIYCVGWNAFEKLVFARDFGEFS